MLRFKHLLKALKLHFNLSLLTSLRFSGESVGVPVGRPRLKGVLFPVSLSRRVSSLDIENNILRKNIVRTLVLRVYDVKIRCCCHVCDRRCKYRKISIILYDHLFNFHVLYTGHSEDVNQAF